MIYVKTDKRTMFFQIESLMIEEGKEIIIANTSIVLDYLYFKKDNKYKAVYEQDKKKTIYETVEEISVDGVIVYKLS